METPTIIIEGKKYKAGKPKVKLWRRIVDFNKHFGSMDDFHVNLEGYEAMLGLLAECFGNPDITPEAVEENLEINELLPKFQEVTTWIGELISGQTQNIPGKN